MGGRRRARGVCWQRPRRTCGRGCYVVGFATCGAVPLRSANDRRAAFPSNAKVRRLPKPEPKPQSLPRGHPPPVLDGLMPGCVMDYASWKRVASEEIRRGRAQNQNRGPSGRRGEREWRQKKKEIRKRWKGWAGKRRRESSSAMCGCDTGFCFSYRSGSRSNTNENNIDAFTCVYPYQTFFYESQAQSQDRGRGTP